MDTGQAKDFTPVCFVCEQDISNNLQTSERNLVDGLGVCQWAIGPILMKIQIQIFFKVMRDGAKNDVEHDISKSCRWVLKKKHLVDEFGRWQEQADSNLVQAQMQVRPIRGIQNVKCSAAGGGMRSTEFHSGP